MRNLSRITLLFLMVLSALRLSAQSTNVIVDDTWADGTYTNWDLPTDSPWWYNTSTSNVFLIGAQTNSMFLTNYDAPTFNNSTKTFWTYFTTNAPELTVSIPTNDIISGTSNVFYGYPISLANGETLAASFQFIPTGEFLDSGNSGVRFGLLSYDHADHGRCARNTANISKSGTNVTGYRLQIPMYLNWTNNNIIALHARTNLNGISDSVDPMGKANDWFSLGASPGQTNTQGFVDGGLYTIDFSVTHYATSNVISSTLSGPLAGVPSTNFTRTTIDTSGSNYSKFDCFMIRVDTSALASDLFIVKEFRIVKISPASAVVQFPITSAMIPGANQFALTWQSVSGQNYQVQSSDSLAPQSWSSNATVTATGSSTSWTNSGLSGIPQRFYRVVATP